MNGVEKDDGMSYAGNDNGLYETTKNFDEYMGYNAVDEGFYTTGHPGEESDFLNQSVLSEVFIEARY